MSDRVEKAVAPLVGVAGAAAYWAFCRQVPFPEGTRDLLTATISVTAIAIGFIATMKSVVVSLFPTRVLKQMSRGGFDRLLFGYMMWAIRLCFILCIGSSIALVVPIPKSAPPGALGQILVASWVGLAGATAVLCYEVIHFTSRLLEAVSGKEPDIGRT